MYRYCIGIVGYDDFHDKSLRDPGDAADLRIVALQPAPGLPMNHSFAGDMP
nr:hypothetical protein [Herbaspirillum sp. ASV7]